MQKSIYKYYSFIHVFIYLLIHSFIPPPPPPPTFHFQGYGCRHVTQWAVSPFKLDFFDLSKLGAFFLFFAHCAFILAAFVAEAELQIACVLQIQASIVNSVVFSSVLLRTLCAMCSDV